MKTLIDKNLLVLVVLVFVVLGCRGLMPGEPAPNTNNASPAPSATPTASPKPTYKKADASKSEIPSDEELQDMVKTTLLDFNDAVAKGDFADFHTRIAKAWQTQVTPETFNTSFGKFIENKINIGNISSKEASFSPEPKIDRSRGLRELVVEGRYDTSPLPVKFELKYVPEGKEWKLYGISVDTTKD